MSSAATACPRRSSAGRDKGWTSGSSIPASSAGTGGLLREPGLMDARRRFDGRAWLQARGLAPRPGERVVSLFCYAGAPVDALLQALADAPTLLLLTPGAAAQALRPTPRPPTLRCAALPWLTPARLRPPAVGLRPELRARRGFLRARAVGRRALRLADLPAARRRARRQAGRLPGPDAGRRRRRPGRGRAQAVAGLERPAGRGRCALPAMQRLAGAGTTLARAAAGPARPGHPAARLRRPKGAKIAGFARRQLGPCRLAPQRPPRNPL